MLTGAVVFDLGGVLIDWDPRYLYRTLLPDEAAVENFLAEVDFMAWNLEQDRGRPWPEAVAELSALHPDRAGLIESYDQRWRESIAGDYPANVDVLRELHAAGHPLFALSNFSAAKFALLRHELEWFDLFDGWVVSGEHGLVKPDLAIYRLLIDIYDLDPRSTTYVDDVADNAQAARELGMTAVHLRDPEDLRAELTLLGVLDGQRPRAF